MATPRVKLGELLVQGQIITRQQLEEVLTLQKADGRRLGTLLVESGLVTETQVTQLLSQQLSVPWVSLYHIDFSRQLLNLVPRELAEKYCLVPIFVRRVRGLGEALYVAMDDPSDENAQREIGQFSGLPVRAMIAPPADIRGAIRAYYGKSEAPPVASPEREKKNETPGSAPAASTLVSTPASAPLTLPSGATAARAPVKDSPSGATAAPAPAKEAPSGAKAAPAPVKEAPSAAKAAPAPVKGAPSVAKPAAAPLPVKDAPSGPRATSLLGSEGRERISSIPDSSPQIESREITMPTPKRGKSARMISLTLLDGTQINLPARDERPSSPDVGASPEQLTARDLIAALRAASHGADASEILGENARWEPLFAALLSVLLKKHLIADWEFIEEYKKV
jgi:type IV pilus assembly protein PilB